MSRRHATSRLTLVPALTLAFLAVACSDSTGPSIEKNSASPSTAAPMPTGTTGTQTGSTPDVSDRRRLTSPSMLKSKSPYVRPGEVSAGPVYIPSPSVACVSDPHIGRRVSVLQAYVRNKLDWQWGGSMLFNQYITATVYLLGFYPTRPRGKLWAQGLGNGLISGASLGKIGIQCLMPPSC